MHIVFRVLRQVVVDDVADVVNMQPATRHVRCHQHVHITGAEAFQGAKAFFLGYVTGQQTCLESVAVQSGFQFPGLVAPVHKYQDTFNMVVMNNVVEHPVFFFLGSEKHLLVNSIHRNLFRLNCDAHRVQRPGTGQALDILTVGGAEKLCLARLFFRCSPDNGFNIGYKAHAQHPVRLINDQDFHLGKINRAGAGEVQQPAGCCHHYIDGAFELLLLALIINTPHQTDDLDVRVAGQAVSVLFDLQGQFPGRGNNQCEGGARASCCHWRIFQVVSQNGDQEGRCFSGPRLCLGNDVSAVQRMGQYLALHLGGGTEPQVHNGMLQGFGQFELCKVFG